jgi:hypothetical protein
MALGTTTNLPYAVFVCCPGDWPCASCWHVVLAHVWRELAQPWYVLAELYLYECMLASPAFCSTGCSLRAVVKPLTAGVEIERSGCLLLPLLANAAGMSGFPHAPACASSCPVQYLLFAAVQYEGGCVRVDPGHKPVATCRLSLMHPQAVCWLPWGAAELCSWHDV